MMDDEKSVGKSEDRHFPSWEDASYHVLHLVVASLQCGLFIDLTLGHARGNSEWPMGIIGTSIIFLSLTFVSLYASFTLKNTRREHELALYRDSLFKGVEGVLDQYADELELNGKDQKRYDESLLRIRTALDR